MYDDTWIRSIETVLNNTAGTIGTTKVLNVNIIGSTGAASITSGRKAVATAGTAVALVGSPTSCFRVDLSADLGNSNPVVVGGSGVVAANDSQEGIVLIPGNDPITILIDDVSKLYVDSQTNGDAVCFNYYSY